MQNIFSNIEVIKLKIFNSILGERSKTTQNLLQEMQLPQSA